MKIEIKQVLSYFCLRCNKLHYEKDGLFKEHKLYQDNHGIRLRIIQKKTNQTDLVKNFNFPNVQKKLKLGEKKIE